MSKTEAYDPLLDEAKRAAALRETLREGAAKRIEDSLDDTSGPSGNAAIHRTNNAGRTYGDAGKPVPFPTNR